MKSTDEAPLTLITGAVPNRPPNSIISPSFPLGMIRTAVVFMLITPIAASSAIIAAIVSAGVSSGMAIISNPTEQIAVIASSFSKLREPFCTAAIIPSSSETGIKAPDKPPTWLQAITPPFLTWSFKRAKAAVVPCVPTVSSPISSRTRATESPTAGVGAKLKSTIPNSTPSLSLAI
ncbi:Uncharacterised protein [Streptococcus pneumoniae]|nr:Uncharacterised protein [Streptococcus pneumoniae]